MNMYKEFIAKNYQEYCKIISTLKSCQSLENFDCVQKMAIAFARNCDHRESLLCMSDCRKYRDSASAQIDGVMEEMKSWFQGYNEALEIAKQVELEEIEESKKRKPIKGFQQLLPKKKPKKKAK
jgi:hypothetical protein